MGRVQLEPNVFLDYDDEWSFVIMNNQPVNIPNGTVVYASDFSSETPDATPFRSDMTGVIFVKCNLSNVIVPNQEGG